MALTMAIDMVKGKSKIAFQAALATAIASIGITLVGADLMHNVLITNLQIWRALWIVHWMALAALPIVVVRLWSENATGRLVAGLALLARSSGTAGGPGRHGDCRDLVQLSKATRAEAGRSVDRDLRAGFGRIRRVGILRLSGVRACFLRFRRTDRRFHCSCSVQTVSAAAVCLGNCVVRTVAAAQSASPALSVAGALGCRGCRLESAHAVRRLYVEVRGCSRLFLAHRQAGSKPAPVR